MKININRKILKREEITSRQNFGKLFHDYNKMNGSLFKTKWFWGSSGIAALLIGAIIIFNIIKPEQKDTAFVNPPLKNIEILENHFEISANTDTILHYKTGTSIKIPAGIFVDKKGKNVSGKVNIQYKEFRDKADIFLSGIPMNYDSAGTNYVFESAGMMEIKGFADGNPVYIKNGKSIDINFASDYPGNDYNLYLLDTVNRRWIYQGESMITEIKSALTDSSDSDPHPFEPTRLVLANLNKELLEVKDQVTMLQKQKPVLPRKTSDKLQQFSLDVDSSQFPEISAYKNMVFEIGMENKNVPENAFDILYQDIKMEPYSTGVSYKLTLFTSAGKEKVTYIVYPAFDEKNYDNAMQQYKLQFNKYEKLLAQRKNQEKKKRLEMEAAAKTVNQNILITSSSSYNTNSQTTDTTADPDYLQSVQRALAYGSYYRYIEVNNFGTWNCDRPIPPPMTKTLIAAFTDEKNNKLFFKEIYLAEKSRNIIYTFYQYPNAEIKYNPAVSNMIWGITEDGKLAMFSYNDFEKIDTKNMSFTFKMKVSNKHFKTPEEVKIFLNS